MYPTLLGGNGRLREGIISRSRSEVGKSRPETFTTGRGEKRTSPKGESLFNRTIITVTCSVVTPWRVSTLMVANSRSGHSAGPNSASSTWSSTWSTSWTTTGVRCFSAVNNVGSSDGLARCGIGPRISRTVSSVAVSDVDNCSAGACNTRVCVVDIGEKKMKQILNRS